MEKMINVINDNLRTVINGIKTHKEETEKNLVTIKNEMDDKIAIASEYKMNVEHARTIISNLENEISELENDLSELNAKFGAKDFKEILAAGNKEINTKIIEKRALINEQSDKILEITEKAHVLKEELLRLKERKSNAEDTLSKTIILEGYYEKRITSIIDYSQDHPNDLEGFVEEVPQEELLVSGEDLENVDLSNIIDGSVFEEIDEISSNSEVDEDLIKEVLVNENAILDESDDSENDETSTSPIDLSMTQQLDDIILQANNLLEKSESIKDKIDTKDESDTNLEKENFSEGLKAETEETDEEQIENIHIFVNDDLDNMGIPDELVITPSNELEETENIVEEKEEMDKPAPVDAQVENVVEEVSEVDKLSINDIAETIRQIEEETEEDEDGVINLVIENDGLEETSFEEFIKETTIPEKHDENIISERIFDNKEVNFYQELRECELDIVEFKEKDINKLKGVFNKKNTQDFIDVMRKHNISVSKIYDAVDVLINVTPQNLDQMISMLKGANISSEAISYVFDSLDKVNMNKLEESLSVNKESELSEILYEAIPYKGESDLLIKLELTPEEEMELRKNATVDEFKIMNMFPEIVLANYNALKDLEIKNLNECITKHPHKFIYNPDHFAEILDKYDTEDLIRCINKNSAVIDKL